MILSNDLTMSDIRKDGPKNLKIKIPRGSSGIKTSMAPKQKIECRQASHKNAAAPATKVGARSDTPNTLNKPASKKIDTKPQIANGHANRLSGSVTDCAATFISTDYFWSSMQATALAATA